MIAGNVVLAYTVVHFSKKENSFNWIWAISEDLRYYYVIIHENNCVIE